MRKHWLLGSLLLVSVLTGCGTEDSSVDTVVQAESTQASTKSELADVELPEGVLNGSVSLELVNDLLTLIDDLGNYAYHPEYMIKFNEMDKQSPDRAVLDEYKDKLTQHDIYLEGFYLTGGTEEELELISHFDNYVYHIQTRNSYLKQYTDEMDGMYRNLASEENDQADISMNALLNAMEKHQLFVD